MRKLTALVALLFGCGGADSRPLSLEVRGLSARAETLTVGLFPQESGQKCSGVNLETAAGFAAPVSQTWTRSSGAERSFEFEEVQETDSLTVIAYSKNAAGTPIQFLCAGVEYESIFGLVIVRLSERPSDIP